MKHSLLMAALLLLVSVSASAYDFMYNGLCYKITSNNPKTAKVVSQYTYSNTSVKARYDDINGTLVIPQYANYNGNSYLVTAIDDYAFFHTHGNLTRIEIAPSVETIGTRGMSFFVSDSEFDVVFTDAANSNLKTIKKHALSWNRQIRSIEIPASVTAVEDSALYWCSLTSLKFREPSQLTTIGDGAFAHLWQLNQSLEVPGSVTSFGRKAFAECYWITSVVLKEGITAVSDLMFSMGTNITSVSFPSTLKTIGSYAFSSNYKLASINIPNSVTSIGGSAFSGDSSLTTVTIPSSVTTMGGGVFGECTALKSAIVNNSVMGGSQFRGCKGLENITLSSSITEIPSNCFYNTAFKKFTIPASIKTIGAWAFQKSKIETLTVDAELETVGNDAFKETPVKTLNVNSNTFQSSMFPDLRSTVTTATYGNKVTAVAEGSLQDFALLETLTMPEGVKSIGNSAFSGCTQLMNIYAKMPRPFAIDASVFSGVQQQGYCDLHVIEGSKGRYQAMPVWRDFYMITEDAGSGGGQSGITGDVNGDGMVDVDDVNKVINIILDIE